ncbi:E3 ubiquitin-protein ligase PEP5 [Lachancea thermotolerans]
MSFQSWRQFQFFENTPVRDPKIGSDSPLFSDPTLSAACPALEDKLFIVVQSRILKLVNLKSLEVELEFEAYSEGFQVTYLRFVADNYIVSAAEQLGRPCSIKIWKLDKQPKNEFDYHSLIEVKNGKNTFPLSAISIWHDLTCLAIGFVNGRIVLIRGDIIHDRGSRQRVIYDDPNKEPITGLMFYRDCRTCFASTTSGIFLFNTTGRNNGKPDTILNGSAGLDLNCSCLSCDGQEFICCSAKSLDFYKSNGEKRSLVMELPLIKRVYAVDQHHILILLGVQTSNNTALNVANITTTNNRVIVLDIQNKLIAMNTLISGSVLDIFSNVFSGDPSVLLLTSDGTMHKINEKPIKEKLQIVEQKELFPVALDLAQQCNLSAIEIEKIRKKYAEHLYKINLKTEAIEQYLQCLNVTETSEVIAKFGINSTSDNSSVSDLSYYLLSMMKKGMSSSDHVTLYLIALIKLKNEEGIEQFVTHFSRSGQYLEEEEPEEDWKQDDESYYFSDTELFDLDLILRLLQDFGFFLQSFKLARKFSKGPAVVVEILIDGLKDPHSALRYIKSLPVDDTLRVLVAFSKKLLELLPNDTNALLIELFTGKYQPLKYESVSDPVVSRREKFDKNVFYSYNSFIEYMKNVSTSKEQDIISSVPTYQPPKPTLIFTSFINQPFEFVVFLEACLGSYNEFHGFDHDKQLILTTLYDIYLTLAKDDEKGRQQEWRDKAHTVYKESTKLATTSAASVDSSSAGRLNKAVDNSLMMLISQVNNFEAVLEGDDLQDELEFAKFGKLDLTYKFRSISLTNDAKTSLKFIEKFGEQEPALYSMGLSHFISSKSMMKEIGGEAVFREKILNKVLEKDLMPLLDILQVLGSSNVASFGLVQQILIEHIKSESQEIRNNKKLIQSYESELEEKESKLQSLTDDKSPAQIKLKNQTCNICQTALSAPLVFFKCDHIYHQRCLNEEESPGSNNRFFRCPQCVVDFEASENMKRAQSETQIDTELLNLAMNDKDNKDRFKIVTDFIGRGGVESSFMRVQELD